MTSSTASLLLVVAASAQPYEEAYHTMKSDGRPLLVLVGADWCPACQTMKSRTLAQMERSGKLRGVVFTVVDFDRQPNLAQQIMHGSSIPQLVMFRRSERGWKRTQLTGGQSEDRIEGFIATGPQPSRANLASIAASGGQ